MTRHLRMLAEKRLRFTATVKARQPKRQTRQRVIGRSRDQAILLTNVCLLDSGQLVFNELRKDAGK